jgi:predicted MFS family arabinose efflux permease
MTLVYALVKAPTLGWTQHVTLTYFAISIIALVAFIINEHRATHPLMPLRIFKIRNLSGADSLQLFMSAGIFSIFFFTTLYMQEILGYSPVKTGFSFLVIPVIIAIAATNVPRLIQRIGYRPILIVAPLLVSVGLFWISHIPVHGTFWGNVAPGMCVFALGMGATFVSVSIAATSGVPKHEAGLASGLLNTSQQIGGSIGLAVLTGIAASVTSRYITNLHLTSAPSNQIQAAALVHGFHDGFLIASTFGIGASLIATFVIRAQKAKTDPSHGEPVAAL